MNDFIFYIAIYIAVLITYLVLIVGKKKKLDKYTNSVEVRYLLSVYKLDIKKLNIKKLSKVLAATNAFIITSTLYLTSFFSELIIKLGLGFVILIVLELLIYHIIGKYLKKRGI